MTSAQRLGLRTRQIVWWSLWVGGIACLIYCVYENFSPSEAVTEYAPFVWIPLALGFIVFLLAKCADFHVKIPAWKKVAGIIVLLGMVPYFAMIATGYGVPALLNRIVGEPFESQTIVVKKSWNRVFGPTLKALNCETILGKILTSESVWREVQRGDTVTLSGVQSALGQAIDTMKVPQARAGQTSAVPSNTTHDNDLLRAIEGGDFAMAQVCLARGATSNARTLEGITALGCAATKGDVGMIKLLLRKGADLDAKNRRGSTAFFSACAFGHVRAAELLAREGAKIDEPNLDGSTPLIIACLAGRTDVVKFLVEKGASLNTRDSYGNTPLLAAKRKSLRPQPDIVKLLEERRAAE